MRQVTTKNDLDDFAIFVSLTLTFELLRSRISGAIGGQSRNILVFT